MKNIISKYIALVLAIFALSAAFLSIRSTRGQESRRNNDSANESRALLEAIRHGGLREAARIKGHYVGTILTSQWLKYDIDMLAKNSAAVIIGTAVENVSRLTEDGRQITTNYQVIVQEGLKGNIQEGSTITASLPGGRVEFEDGTSAELVTPGFSRMVNGETYVLFLSKKKDESSTFILTGGPQGSFQIPADGTGIKPSGHSSDIVQKHKGKDAKAFLKEVREAVKKWPEPSACCG